MPNSGVYRGVKRDDGGGTTGDTWIGGGGDRDGLTHLVPRQAVAAGMHIHHDKPGG